MTHHKPTHKEISHALGLAEGFSSEHNPNVLPRSPRRLLEKQLKLQIVPHCYHVAYYLGVLEGRELREELDFGFWDLAFESKF